MNTNGEKFQLKQIRLYQLDKLWTIDVPLNKYTRRFVFPTWWDAYFILIPIFGKIYWSKSMGKNLEEIYEKWTLELTQKSELVKYEVIKQA